MKNTKEKILRSAQQLFNKYGVADTSLRKIALDIGISQGNLNYHFKKREDILEALYFEMVYVFDERIKRTVNDEISLDLIYSESKISMERMYDYRFIWLDLHQIIRENERIRNHFLEAQTQRKSGLTFVFSQLMKQSIIEKESYPNEHEQLFLRLINFSDFWICSADIYKSLKGKACVNEYHAIYFGMFYRYLTEKGKEIFKGLIV